ncbi:MAG: DUF4340 domain-containing protein [Oscillospiraceae bacterium]|nr:DUF4340 domain-containing protein [Oscillospiraceae bacterium]
MKRGKKLGVLLLALAVLCGAAVLISQLTKDSAQATEEDEAVTILEVDSSQVTQLSWTYTESLSFTYDGENWTYTEDEDFPLDESCLEDMLDALNGLAASKTIENVEDYEQYGLEDPACTVTVEGESQVVLKIGDESSSGESLYVSLGDGNVYMVDASLLDSFACGLYDLVDTESIPSMSNVVSLAIDAQGQSMEIVYLEDSGLAYSDSYVWFLSGEDGYTTLDTELTETLLETFTGLSWASCVDYDAQDLSPYGLDDPAATVTVTYTVTTEVETNETDDDGNAVTETVESEETFTLEIGDYADSSCYARIAGSGMVYLVDAAVSDMALYTTAEDLLPDDILLMDWDGVSSVDVTLDGETYTFLKETVLVEDEDSEDEETEETYETVWTVDGTEVDGASIWDALDALASTGSGSGLSTDRTVEISFTIYQDNENYPQVELTFYQYDSSSCLVSLNGEARLFVSRSDIVSLAELVNETVLDLED